MSTTLTGNSTGITDGGTVSTTAPADGDPRTAASVNTSLQYLLNRAKYLADFVTKTHTWTAVQTWSAANVFSVAQVWNALQTFANGVAATSTTDLLPPFESTKVPTGTRQLVARFKGKSGFTGRLYTTAGGMELVSNAIWDGTDWRYENNGQATALTITTVQVEFYTANSGTAGNVITFIGTTAVGGVAFQGTDANVTTVNATTANLTGDVNTGGIISITSGNPAWNSGYVNKLTKANIVKAWLSFTLNGSNNPTINDAFNIYSVDIGGVIGGAFYASHVGIRLAGSTLMTVGNGVGIASTGWGPALCSHNFHHTDIFSTTRDAFDFRMVDSTGAVVDLNNGYYNGIECNLIVIGKQ